MPWVGTCCFISCSYPLARADAAIPCPAHCRQWLLAGDGRQAASLDALAAECAGVAPADAREPQMVQLMVGSGPGEKNTARRVRLCVLQANPHTLVANQRTHCPSFRAVILPPHTHTAARQLR